MELIVTVLLAFPLGLALRSRTAAYLAYIAVHSFVFTFQSLVLLRAWTGGDTSAFPAGADTVPWSYGLVNAVIYAAGLGLVALGHRVRSRRAARPEQAADLAG
jgi:hypothetical protein